MSPVSRLRSFRPDKKLTEMLRSAGITEPVVQSVVESGYYMRHWSDLMGGTYETVSDLMYGNKQSSSSFGFDAFVRYLKGDNSFASAPPLVEFTVRNMGDINAVLADARRQHYTAEGSLTFRGQVREYRYRRPVPNPYRKSADGTELSVLPGAFRQSGAEYRFPVEPPVGLSMDWLLHELEPNNPNVYSDSQFAHDPMRVEQHYASQTTGLDLTFDINTALFFATHQFTTSGGIATLKPVSKGAHRGVIYLFRFTSPTVKKSEFYVRDFDLFKTYPPERILRQNCGLPLIGHFERNISICDIDCILRLDSDFECDALRSPTEIFPSAAEDPFYRKLLELKRQFPDELSEVVEYEWARS
jgi:hypothetical protein